MDKVFIPHEKKVLVSIGSSTFFANFQYFRAKKVLDPILTNTFFSYGKTWPATHLRLKIFQLEIFEPACFGNIPRPIYDVTILMYRDIMLVDFIQVDNLWTRSESSLTLRSHTTGEFHVSHHTGSILPSQFQKTMVKKLSVPCGSKNYGTCFEYSRLRTKSRFVRNHLTTCSKNYQEVKAQKAFSLKKS